MAAPARRLLASLNLLTSLLLLGVLFIMVNFVSSRRYARWDLTKQRITALSDQTTQTLKALTEPLSIIVFYQPNQRLYGLIKDQLAEYERFGSAITVEYVDPQQDIARAKQLAQQFAIQDLNLVIFQSGSRHKYLSDTDLAEYDFGAARMGGEPRVKAFKGEEAFTSAIISVTRAESPLIWVTTGHGEKSMDAADPSGLSQLKQSLQQQNMSVETATLLERTEIPSTVKLVVVAGPTHRFAEAEVSLLLAYLKNGGRLLALLDPLVDSGLDGLLEQWGLRVGADIVVDPARQLPFVSAANLFITTYTAHPIVEKMKTLMTLYPLARSVRPAEPAPEGITAMPLALTSPQGWGESQTAVEAFEFNDGEDLKGPVSIAAAAEQASSRARIVVIGDSDFAMNAQLDNVGNRDMLLGALYWLIAQEQLIGIGPRTIDTIKLTLTAAQLTGIFWFSLLALPLTCGMLGVGMWLLRRQ